MLSDEVLMLQFKSGSPESLEELFARYKDPLYAFFRRRLAAKETAEDLAQETWTAVLRGVARYEPRALFRTYLYGIGLKLLAGEHRRNARQNPVKAANHIVFTETLESDRWIGEALGKLDATEREILMLREYEQLSYAEIADLLHLPINTVRSRLFRARLAFKRLLEPDSGVIAAQGRL